MTVKKLPCSWTLWFHSPAETSWDISSYQKVATIDTIEDFWNVYSRMTNSIVEDKDKVYEGFAEVLVDDEFIERFYDHEEMVLEESMVKEKLYPNQFLLLISSSNPKKSAICRFSDHKTPLKSMTYTMQLIPTP